jgi:hypothetical protein
MITLAFLFEKYLARDSPIPEDAPVIRTVLSLNSGYLTFLKIVLTIK